MPDPPSDVACWSPLIASRSLGRLLGLESLSFKVECWQPGGSWLDRSAAALIAAAVADRVTGLCAVGLDVWTLPLAIRCARAGVRFVVLEAADGSAAVHPEERGWLSALGVRTVAVQADIQALRDAAPVAAERAGLRLMASDDPLLDVGLSILVQEIELAGHTNALLAVPDLTSREARWLARGIRPFPAVVGRLATTAECESNHDRSLVLSMTISTREADAARRLLAREEGLIVSRRGGAGLAGLVRAVREDRALRPRERRLRGVTSAVVVVTDEPLRAGDAPPLEPDAVRTRAASLASLVNDPARLLVEPPGR